MSALLLVMAAQVLAGSNVLQHGGYLDLDTQTASNREEGADLRFLLDGDKGTIVAMHGAKVTQLAAADLDDLAQWDGDLDNKQKRHRIDRNATLGFGVKTSDGKLALVRVFFPAHEDAPGAVFTYRYQPDGTGEFPLAPDPPMLVEEKDGLTLQWSAEEKTEHGVFLREEGAWKLVATVATPSWTVPKVEKGKFLRVRIARKVGADSWSEALETTVAGTPVGVKSGTHTIEDYRRSGSFSFDDDKEDRTPDLALLRDGVAAAHPGGVLHIGRGKKKFRAIRSVPAHGYLPSWRAIEDGDVLIVKLQDGRFAKVMYTKKAWYQHHFTYELLGDGGSRFPLAPKFKKQTWDEEKGALTLEIQGDKLENGRLYKVSRGTPSGGLEEVGTTAETTFVDKKAPKRTLLVYSLVLKEPSGRETAPRTLEVDTFPESWTRGEFKLNGSNPSARQGYSFSQQEVMKNGAGDLILTSMTGGASSLTFSTPKGSWGPEPWAGARRGKNAPASGFPSYGELADFDFEEVKAKLEKKDYRCDERDPGSDIFWVKAGKKSIAQVRVSERKYPDVVFEYILIPPD